MPQRCTVSVAASLPASLILMDLGVMQARFPSAEGAKRVRLG